MSHQKSYEVVLVPTHIQDFANTPDIARVEVGRLALTIHSVASKTDRFMGVVIYYMNEPVQFHFAGILENKQCSLKMTDETFNHLVRLIPLTFLTYLKGFQDNFTKMRNIGKNYIQPDLIVKIAMLEQQLIARAIVKNPNFLEAFEDWQYAYELDPDDDFDEEIMLDDMFDLEIDEYPVFNGNDVEEEDIEPADLSIFSNFFDELEEKDDDNS